jgi:ankyrin repeat protein
MVVKFLVEKGAVVDQPNNDGTTALGMASLTGHLEVVDFLLSVDANINCCNIHGLASQEGHLKVVKLLVKRGANIHQASDLGLAPLHVAALKGHKEVVDYLMSKGATFEAAGTLAKVCKCCGAPDAWSLLDCLLLLQGMSGEGLEGGG